MRNKIILLILFACGVALGAKAQNLHDYNSALPLWGTTWTPGEKNVRGYYPSFYTGFAVRSEFPDRIHIRLARGNQTRVSVVLDDQTLQDYLFDLVARDHFYSELIARKIIDVAPHSAAFLPQVDFYHQMINSPQYDIATTVMQAERGLISDSGLYEKSLQVLEALNPDRVFHLEINLRDEFLRWKQQALINVSSGAILDSETAAEIINQMVWGRVNMTSEPSAALIRQLQNTIVSAKSGNEDQFTLAAVQLFQMATGNKYSFRVFRNGRWESPIQCAEAKDCYLRYPEFTAVYPTGSIKGQTRDQFGNSISNFATPGLWRFVSRGSRNVDNIRDEQYYGWIPKMDYEAIGNGFHNPAVRFGGLSTAVKKTMNIQPDHSIFWSVKRGGVSHGCSRLAAGHIWEMRHIMPVEDRKMVQVHHFGNRAQEFDLYDIDGDGRLEVMGVEYLISYGLQGASGLASREGQDLQINFDRKTAFYKDLYGEHNVFQITNSGEYTFVNPTTAIHTFSDLKRHSVSLTLTLKGNYALYEQPYEKDKIQFYAPVTSAGLLEKGAHPLSKRLARLMGRVRGCAPKTNKDQCGQNAFTSEYRSIMAELGR